MHTQAYGHPYAILSQETLLLEFLLLSSAVPKSARDQAVFQRTVLNSWIFKSLPQKQKTNKPPCHAFNPFDVGFTEMVSLCLCYSHFSLKVLRILIAEFLSIIYTALVLMQNVVSNGFIMLNIKISVLEVLTLT